MVIVNIVIFIWNYIAIKFNIMVTSITVDNNNNNNNNKYGLYTTYLRILSLIKGVHKNAITMKIYMSTIIKLDRRI